jgi:isoleucyl-tRNA synthetase
VQLQDWPQPSPQWSDPFLEEAYEGLMEVRDQVTKAIEEKRVAKELGTSLEAKVRLGVPTTLSNLLEAREKQLPTVFIVSQVELERSEDGELHVEISRASGKKCARCWNYRPSVGSEPDHPEICDRCLPVILGAGPVES